MMRVAAITILVGSALGLSGCVQAPGNMQADFGASMRQNVAAQVADPGARYKRADPPASSGPRTSIAQERYNKGKVLQPSTPTTSALGNGGSGGNGGGDGKQ